METEEHVHRGEVIGLSDDEVHRLLAAERRRLVIDIIASGGPRGLEELAEEIVTRERHGDVTEHAVNRTAVDLYHCHLPLMADLEAIDFDPHEKCIVGCRIGPEGL